jgi:hypothetical protein
VGITDMRGGFHAGGVRAGSMSAMSVPVQVGHRWSAPYGGAAAGPAAVGLERLALRPPMATMGLLSLCIGLAQREGSPMRSAALAAHIPGPPALPGVWARAGTSEGGLRVRRPGSDRVGVPANHAVGSRAAPVHHEGDLHVDRRSPTHSNGSTSK